MKDMNVGESRRKPRQKDEPETISDLEDEDDAEMGGEMVVPDDEDPDVEDSGDNTSGLQDRYKRALKDQAGPADEDFSFARYLRSANVG